MFGLQALDEAAGRHDVRWVWVKGHDGDPGNEMADALANTEIASPVVPLVANVLAQAVTDPATIRSLSEESLL